MSPDEFDRLANLFPEPVLLVAGDGTLMAGCAREELGLPEDLRPGGRIQDLFDDAEGGLTAYLRQCGRSAKPLPGSLRWTTPDGERRQTKCFGGRLTGPSPGEVRIGLRIANARQATDRFAALNQKIGELERALHQRREAENAARAERERLEVTLASIGDAVAVTDDAGHVTFLNAVAEGLTGWTTDEAAGRPLTDAFRIVNEETRATVESPVDRVLREGQIVGLANHTVLIAKDGTERPIDDSAAPIRTADGALAGVVLVFRDVTDRKAAESALREESSAVEALHRVGTALAAELDLERIVQLVTDEGTALTAAQFGAFFYNTTTETGEAYLLYTLSGVPREAFADFPLPRATDLFGPTFRGEGVIRLDDVLADPRYGRNAPRRGMPEGHLPVRSYLAVPVVSRTGDVIGGLFFGHPDVGRFTDRHERLTTGLAAQAAITIDNARLFEQARRERAAAALGEERLRLAVAIAQLGTFEIDLLTDAVRVNDIGRAIYGWADGEPLTFAKVQGHFHPDDRDEVLRRVGAAFDPAGPGEFEVEQRIVRADGETRWIRVRGRTIFDGVDGDRRAVRSVGTYLDVTDVKRTEEALRAGEARFRALTDVSPLIVFESDPDGQTTYCSQRWYDYTGLRPEQTVGGGWAAALHPDHLEPAVVAFRKAAAGGFGYEREMPLRGADGTYRWHLVRSMPVRDDLGGIEKWVGVSVDIDDRKRAEEALRESEERLRLALEAGQMGTWDWEVATGRVTWSPTLEAIYGLPPGGFPGTLDAYSEALHPEDREAVFRSVQEAVRTGGEHVIDHRVVWPDGSVHWVEGRGRIFRDAAGVPTRMAGVCTNVDVRRRSDQNAAFLARVNVALSALVDFESTLQRIAALAVPAFADWCAIDMVDESGDLRRVALSHADPEKVELGLDLARRYPPRKDEPRGAFQVQRTGVSEFVADIPDELIAAAAVDAEHLRILRDLGLKTYICVPLSVRGQTVGVISFIGAESGRRYDEADLKVAEDLAQRAGVAIDNARLYRELRDADRRKNEFLAMLGHELRNPLAPIRSALSLLDASDLDPATAAEARDTMSRQVDHLVRLVDDLLDVSRIMRGRVELRKEPVELQQVVRRAVESSLPLIRGQRHAFDLSLPDGPIWLDADPVRLSQVFGNLLNNAAKYTEPGGRVALSAEPSVDRVTVRVRDDGLGIEPDLLPDIFELFTQSERSIERAQGGLGIGLSLVRALVEMHGGTVEARSDGPGRGSEFVVILPVRPAPTTTAQKPAAPGTVTPRRVLVVEDLVPTARLMAAMLRKFWGHDVRIAHDGLAALETAVDFRPEVVLLDIGLPGMSGYDVARKLRQRPELADTVLVALTGYGQEQDRRLSSEAGFDDHLVKPAGADDLARVFTHPRLARW